MLLLFKETKQMFLACSGKKERKRVVKVTEIKLDGIRGPPLQSNVQIPSLLVDAKNESILQTFFEVFLPVSMLGSGEAGIKRRGLWI